MWETDVLLADDHHDICSYFTDLASKINTLTLIHEIFDTVYTVKSTCLPLMFFFVLRLYGPVNS